jgi:hypothetical protein
VLELVLGRFPSDATILIAFTEHALEVAAAAGNASAAPSLNSTGPAALLTQRGGNATAAAAAAQQQQLEVLVLEQLERAEEARAAAMKDEELSYRRDRLCCWGWQHKIVQDSTERAADSFSLRLSPAMLP